MGKCNNENISSLSFQSVFYKSVMLKRSIISTFAMFAFVLSANGQSYKALRDSLSDVIEALEYHPDSIGLRLCKAGLNVQLEQWQYARDEYDYILERNPNNVAALFYRAFVNEKQGRYNFARADYESLLGILPMHFEARLGLVLLNQKDNHYTEALNQINEMGELFPDSAIVFAIRGGMETERKMYELAEYDYSHAIELDPRNTDYRLSRANLRIIMKRKKEARKDLDELVALGVSRSNLAEYYSKCK